MIYTTTNTETYLAMNGHRMTAQLDSRGEIIQWSAKHSDTCTCMNSGTGDFEPLPDW